ncbi:peptidase M20 [Thalassobaculum fulvum]|uniref:Peptidase M20 n=1 Tax=Thalassobaculum fulvum TaxID=1633335 RepID=A0A919CPU1_9PROT|nr:amidohydrolase [Thalassobaculum fulvum]GHD50870.1 peptidase M20 [Thalassobaculum fulvum]
MFLSNQDVVELVEWRRELHRRPELSGDERETARTVRGFLEGTRPDRLVAGLGGHGVAAVYEGAEPGPTLMFRAELDGLPIAEVSDIPHRSTVPGNGHMCGHDGHMAILAAFARGLGRRRPRRGRAVVLFQPAEENGAGAAAVVDDPKFQEIRPDFAYALHNMPGMTLGRAGLAEGPANCASRGMRVVLTGRTAHASMPEHGVSPMAAVARLMPALTALGTGLGSDGALGPDFTMVTVTHARLGEPAFGIAPGEAELWSTLRTLTDGRMDGLVERAERLVMDAARESGLGFEIDYHDVFRHCENAPAAVAHLRRAMEAEGVPCDPDVPPMRGSEDFGRFGDHAASAMFLLGAGEDHPSLHNPDYDFPDDLIAIGARVFMRTLRDQLG